MADFKKYYDKMIIIEGKYSNDPDDQGGETYKGIARKKETDWDGWKLIDELKSQPGFPNNLETNQDLQKLVMLRHKSKYWDIFDLDNKKDVLAWEFYDIGFNMGIGRAVQFIQEIFNAMNNKQERWSDIPVDKTFGPKTKQIWDEFNKECKKRGLDPDITLAKLLNIKQGAFYFEIMEKNESQEKYAWGWMSRVID